MPRSACAGAQGSYRLIRAFFVRKLHKGPFRTFRIIYCIYSLKYSAAIACTLVHLFPFDPVWEVKKSNMSGSFLNTHEIEQLYL